jgi:hypothetical protein
MYESQINSLRKLSLVSCFAVLLFISLTNPSLSQNGKINTQASLAEKVYLQLDSKVYTTDQTIWFKAIIASAIDHVPNTLTGVLYVELIEQNKSIVDKKLINIENGIGEGFFDLNQSYSPGTYLIRAYTEWNKNFDTDFIFKEYIRVFATNQNEAAEPISNVRLVKKRNNELRLTASLNPLVIDSLHRKKLTVFINLDDTRDSLTISENRDKKYLLDYSIPLDCRIATIQIQTKNLFNYSKSIVLDGDHLDLQFFPESGELVHGLNSKVGFKALDFSGKGKCIEGEIVSRDGEFVTSFKSNQLGMGSFNITKVDSSTAYFARLTSLSEDDLSTMYSLPDIAAIGNVCSVIRKENEIRIIASSNYLNNDSIYIRTSCRGLVYYDFKGRLKEGIFTLSVPANMLPEGIIAFTMMDSGMQPVAENLYFNWRNESRLDISLSTDRNTFIQREKTILHIEAKNSFGAPVNANLSLLVLNKGQMGQLQNTRQNILSYFLLSSDLRGRIETPGYYFGKDSIKRGDLDALLLTQGWRKYKYIKPLNKLDFKPEMNLTVSGHLSNAFSKRGKKEIELTIMTFGDSYYFGTTKTDCLGRFKFDIADEYGSDLNVLIQSAKKSGKKKNYEIEIDTKELPPISFDHLSSMEIIDSVVSELVEKHIERKTVEDAYKLSNGAILLEEVIVEGYSMTPDRKKVTAKYGMPDEIITGKALQENKLDWSSNLFTVLKHKYPEKIAVSRVKYGGGFFLQAYVPNREPSLFVIDGIPARQYEYPMLADIPISEVRSIEIIEHAYNFADIYRKTYTSSSSLIPPPVGNVIALYTREGKGMAGINATIGVMQTSVPVFSNHREFYAPKHENLKADDWYKPDLRAIVHWEPIIIVDSTGYASTTFYNADNIGEMLIVVEAISENGELGYKEIEYIVTEKKW